MDLYREELLDIYKNPTYVGTIPDASLHISQNNPTCGDVINLDLEIKDGVVSNAKFHGDLCMVSQVSSDLLLDKVIGMSLKDTNEFTKEDVLKFFGESLTTSRIKCAELILDALKKAREEYGNKA